MPSLFFQSGWSGTAGQSVTVSATPQTLELQLPVDLAAILTAFKSHLGISCALPGNEISTYDAIYVEWVGLEAAAGDPAREIRLRFHIIKTFPNPEGSITTGGAPYTANRLLRLLEANRTLNGLAGIAGIRQLTALAGSDAPELTTDSGQLSIAVIDVTYSLPESALNRIA